MKRGFTLVELVVTLFVLALAAAVVAPALGRGVDSLRGRVEVSGFAAFLRTAREQAITRGEPQEVRVDPDARELVLATPGSDVTRLSRRFNFLQAIEANPPDALVVTFQPQGLSSGGSFRIQAPGNRNYLVTVDPFTGRVSSRLADS